MLYEAPRTTVEGLERVINKLLRHYLRLPPDFTGLGLNRTSGKLQMPVSSLVEESKVADKCISAAGIDIKDWQEVVSESSCGDSPKPPGTSRHCWHHK